MLNLREIEFAQQRHAAMKADAAKQQQLQAEQAFSADSSLREKMGDLLIAAGERLKAQPQTEAQPAR